jgi:hypothetical protein
MQPVDRGDQRRFTGPHAEEETAPLGGAFGCASITAPATCGYSARRQRPRTPLSSSTVIFVPHLKIVLGVRR